MMQEKSRRIDIIRNSSLNESRKKREQDFPYDEELENDLFRSTLGLRDLLFNTLADPTFNTFSYIFSFFNISAIITSTITFLMGSYGDFVNQDAPSTPLNVVELTCVAYFTFDYLCRLTLTRRNRLSYALSLLNMIDLLAVVPSYLELFLEAKGIGALVVVRILRLFRIFRLVKVAKYAAQLPVLSKALQSSTGGFGIGFFSIFMFLILWGSSIYYSETSSCTLDPSDNLWKYDDGTPTKFQSIPHSLWWTIVTMCTVGYGDAFPITPAGKVVASVVMLCGVMVLAFPLTVLSGNFMDKWSDFLVEQEKETLKSWQRKFYRLLKKAEGTGENQVLALLPTPDRLLKTIWDDLLTLKANIDTCKVAVHSVKMQVKKMELVLKQLDMAIKFAEIERTEGDPDVLAPNPAPVPGTNVTGPNTNC